MPIFDRLTTRFSTAGALRRGMSLLENGDAKRAFPLIARAAQAGLKEAEYRLARCYLEAVGVPPSRPNGVRWLEKAAIQGHIEAQVVLATMCLHGMAEGFAAGGGSLFGDNTQAAPDFQNAAKWARRAAEAGSAEGQAVLAYVLGSGPEDLRNVAEADRWYKQSANGNCPQGHLGHALALARDTANPEVQVEVVRHLRLAAEQGLATALYLYAILCDRGVGVAQDHAQATELYHQAALKGHRGAQAKWGFALTKGIGVAENALEGESWLRRAALAGDAEAAAVVGDLYASGGTLPPNYAEAAMWFRRAAETGHKGASRALGMLFLTGAGVPRDQAEAANWFRVSAEGGDRHAHVDLGNLLLRGEGDDQDSVRTRTWFEQAAASGDPVAAFNYGVCLAEGVGIEKDERKAAEWLRKAADTVVNAQYWLGRMLIEGRGVDQNLEEGRAWVARAASVGMTEALTLMGDLLLTGRGGPKDHPAALAALLKTRKTKKI